mgnify:CR=1 FL=1
MKGSKYLQNLSFTKYVTHWIPLSFATKCFVSIRSAKHLWKVVRVRFSYVIVYCNAGNEVFYASLFIHVIRQSVSWSGIFIGLGVLHCYFNKSFKISLHFLHNTLTQNKILWGLPYLRRGEIYDFVNILFSCLLFVFHHRVSISSMSILVWRMTGVDWYPLVPNVHTSRQVDLNTI